jgi:hypothetical protein
MSRGAYRGGGRGGMCRFIPTILSLTSSFHFAGRGGGRGGYQSRDVGPPDTVVGEDLLLIFL